MKYRNFGRTGIEVSDIARGLWGMGGWSGSDDEQSLEALQLSVDLGCNLLAVARERPSDTPWTQARNELVRSGDFAHCLSVTNSR